MMLKARVRAELAALTEAESCIARPLIEGGGGIGTRELATAPAMVLRTASLGAPPTCWEVFNSA